MNGFSIILERELVEEMPFRYRRENGTQIHDLTKKKPTIFIQHDNLIKKECRLVINIVNESQSNDKLHHFTLEGVDCSHGVYVHTFSMENFYKLPLDFRMCRLKNEERQQFNKIEYLEKMGHTYEMCESPDNDKVVLKIDLFTKMFNNTNWVHVCYYTHTIINSKAKKVIMIEKLKLYTEKKYLIVVDNPGFIKNQYIAKFVNNELNYEEVVPIKVKKNKKHWGKFDYPATIHFNPHFLIITEIDTGIQSEAFPLKPKHKPDHFTGNHQLPIFNTDEPMLMDGSLTILNPEEIDTYLPNTTQTGLMLMDGSLTILNPEEIETYLPNATQTVEDSNGIPSTEWVDLEWLEDSKGIPSTEWVDLEWLEDSNGIPSI